VTRDNYDAQLQQLTMHLMQLQDTEQENESELNRLRNVIKKMENAVLEKCEEEYNLRDETSKFTSNPFL